MIKNEEIINDNFFGIKYDEQFILYSLFKETIECSKRRKYYDSQINKKFEVFEKYIKQKDKLYNFKKAALKIKGRYQAKFRSQNIINLKAYFNYSQAPLPGFDIRDFYQHFKSNNNNLDAFEVMQKFFEFEEVDSKKVKDFIISYNDHNLEDKYKFTSNFLNAYSLIPISILPDEANIETDLDDAVKRLFDKDIYDKYSYLSARQKFSFLNFFGDSLNYFYQEQIKDANERKRRNNKITSSNETTSSSKNNDDESFYLAKKPKLKYFNNKPLNIH